jgi:hypothetical protein
MFLIHNTICQRIFNILNLCGKISTNLPSLRGMTGWVCGHDVETISTWLFSRPFSKLRRKLFLIQKTTLLFWLRIFNILNLRGKSPTMDGKKIWRGMMGDCVDMIWKQSQHDFFPPFFKIGWEIFLDSQDLVVILYAHFDILDRRGKRICVDMMWKRSQLKFFPAFFKIARENVLDSQDHVVVLSAHFNILNLCGKISYHGWKENLPSLRGMMGWVCGYDVKTF